jgi:hypothetical protein
VSKLKDDVRDIVNELDPDGGGYQTAEAASLLVHRYVAAGVCECRCRCPACQEAGQPKPHVRSLMRVGAGTTFKNYKSDTTEDDQKRKRAAAWVTGAGGNTQGDFADIVDDDFDFRWLKVYAAWDEGETAERKMLVRMTLYEVLDVIALKRKKAHEATAVAKLLQDIVDDHPDWYDHPEMTVADILDIRE